MKCVWRTCILAYNYLFDLVDEMLSYSLQDFHVSADVRDPNGDEQIIVWDLLDCLECRLGVGNSVLRGDLVGTERDVE